MEYNLMAFCVKSPRIDGVHFVMVENNTYNDFVI